MIFLSLSLQALLSFLVAVPRSLPKVKALGNLESYTPMLSPSLSSPCRALPWRSISSPLCEEGAFILLPPSTVTRSTLCSFVFLRGGHPLVLLYSNKLEKQLLAPWVNTFLTVPYNLAGFCRVRMQQLRLDRALNIFRGLRGKKQVGSKPGGLQERCNGRAHD